MAARRKYLYCILPSGNSHEFSSLDGELRRRKVRSSYMRFADGRVYRIHAVDSGLLPKDEKGRYLGDEGSGHSIYPIEKGTKFTKGPWVKIHR